MDCVKHDHCYSVMTGDYAMLLEKHIDKYERIFDENEAKFNRYLDLLRIEEITISDDEHSVANKHSDDIVIRSEKLNQNVSEELKKLEKQRQSTSTVNENNIYKNLYKKWTHYRSGCEKPTHVYTCQWWTCRYETNDYKLIISHLSVEHIHTRIYRDYKRSFIELNVYQYKCTRIECEYETKIIDYIDDHIDDHNRCDICDTSFETEDELSSHQSVEHNFRAKISGDNHLKCSYGECTKSFKTQYELSLHEIFNHTCVFKLNDKRYLKDKGVCSLAFIKQYYQKRKVIDGSVPNKVEYRYLCLWSDCCYETYNYNAIQKHVHNSHTCPLFTGVLYNA